VTAREAVEAMLVVLADERAAIRRLDAQAVDDAARSKQALAEVLCAASADELAGVKADIPFLRAELRRNGVLLAHARSCVNELIELTRPRVAGRRGTLRARL
jgi:hypothetical protein